jgi:hypothetical protein
MEASVGWRCAANQPRKVEHLFNPRRNPFGGRCNLTRAMPKCSERAQFINSVLDGPGKMTANLVPRPLSPNPIFNAPPNRLTSASTTRMANYRPPSTRIKMEQRLRARPSIGAYAAWRAGDVNPDMRCSASRRRHRHGDRQVAFGMSPD